MLGLVEGLRNLSREHRVDRANYNQDDWIGERNHVGGVDVRVADEQIILACGIMMHGM